ncbi:MAG: tRNA (adenosine(37)-N6)-dimethylallyltransferase MiaA [Oscillospiraceae bacterium]
MNIEHKKIPLICVVGPTASGKTEIAVEIAKRYNGEVVSADSMQIYKQMSIGTAKPTPTEMCDVPHHLIDMLELSEKFSVADYAKLAHEVIADIYSRGKVPILAGGTGLYINAVTKDINFSEINKDDSVKEELTIILEKSGKEKLYEMLIQLDPQEANTIDKDNTPRLIRALEVCRLTGSTMTEYKKKNIELPSRYECLKIGIDYKNRSELYDRINFRVSIMVEDGLVEEAKEILASGNIQTAMQAIGYKELIGYFNGEITLQEAMDKIRQGSRRYAKRQLTWFRHDEDVNWFYKNTEIDMALYKKIIYNCIDNFIKICYY